MCEPEAKSQIPAKMLTRISFYSLLLYCLVGSLLTVVGAARVIPSSGDLTGGEAVNPFLGTLAARTGQLYHPMSSPPYTPQPFGPLFYVASAGVAQWARLDIDATLRLGRTLDFLCLLLCGVTAWLVVRKIGFSREEAALAAMLLLAQPVFDRWGATMRPDVPALLAMMLALYFALHVQSMAITASALSGFLVGIGFLVKQSAGAAGLAIVLILLLNKRFRSSVVFCIAAGVPVIIALVLLLMHHEQFLEHFLVAGRTSWSLRGAAGWLAEPHLFRPTAVLLFAVAAIGIPRAVESGEQGQMIVSFALVNLFAGFVTVAQLGGQTNYFIPGFAGCALLLPFAMGAFTKNLRAIEVTGVIVFLGCMAAFADCAGTFVGLPSSRSGKIASLGYISSLKVLTDNDYFLVHTRDPVLVDPFTAHSLELRGRWNSSGIVKEIEMAKYDLAILGGGHTIQAYRGITLFGPEIVKALNENYEIAFECGAVIVLKPRSRDFSIAPEMLGIAPHSCVVKPPGPDLIISPFAR